MHVLRHRPWKQSCRSRVLQRLPSSRLWKMLWRRPSVQSSQSRELQRLPANRLAAAGYGEFQPLDDAGSDEARRRNRRIEMKLTQRIAGN